MNMVARLLPLGEVRLAWSGAIKPKSCSRPPINSWPLYVGLAPRLLKFWKQISYLLLAVGCSTSVYGRPLRAQIGQGDDGDDDQPTVGGLFR